MATGLARNIVKRYLAAGVEEPHLAKRVNPNKLDPYDEKVSMWLRSGGRENSGAILGRSTHTVDGSLPSNLHQMKLQMLCHECLPNDPLVGIGIADAFMDVELTHEGSYLCQCPKGHRFITHLQNEHFQMLFELATVAISDGYYREAVTSYTAALERYYEYCIRVFCVAQDVDLNIIDATWKHVGKLSERQFGAYAFLYATAFKKAPVVLTNKRTEFRNDVVHKGHIPNATQALEYGESVREIICASLTELHTTFITPMQGLSMQRMVVGVNFGHGELRRSFKTHPTIISMMTSGEFGKSPDLKQDPRSLAEIVRAFKLAKIPG